METIRKRNEITEGIIWKQLLVFFFPIALGAIFQQLYNVADAVIVGRFLGKEALASVGGSAAMIISVLIGFFNGLTVGASVVISQNYGSKNEKATDKSLHTAYCFSLLTGIILTIMGFLFTPVFLKMMRTPFDTLNGSVIYLRITLLD